MFSEYNFSLIFLYLRMVLEVIFLYIFHHIRSDGTVCQFCGEMGFSDFR